MLCQIKTFTKQFLHEFYGRKLQCSNFFHNGLSNQHKIDKIIYEQAHGTDVKNNKIELIL